MLEEFEPKTRLPGPATEVRGNAASLDEKERKAKKNPFLPFDSLLIFLMLECKTGLEPFKSRTGDPFRIVPLYAIITKFIHGRLLIALA